MILDPFPACSRRVGAPHRQPGFPARLRRARFLLASICFAIGGISIGAGQADAQAPVAAAGETHAAAPQSVLPFIEDDYAAARAAAVARGQLLVVDAWAPWCHTCLSMRNVVFPDARLRPLADHFVYLAVDTELPKNSAFVEQFPIRSLPTLLVLDPKKDDAVLAHMTGAMTAPELLDRLQAVLASQASATEKLAVTGPVPAALQKADAAAAAARWGVAAGLYAQVAAGAAASPGLRARARLGQIQALHADGQHRACAELSDLEYLQVGRGATATDFFSYGGDCTAKLTDPNLQLRLRRQLRTHLEEIVRDPAAPLLPDDRSDGYGTLTELADAMGDRAGGDGYAAERLAILEAAAARAAGPVAAATYDAHRLECYRRLGRFSVAEQMLLASARAMPDDYNPPARLARLYLDMGRLDDGRTAIDRAIAMAQGPRRVSMYELRASILHGLGQTRAAMASLESAIAILQKKGDTSAARVAGLRKNVEALRVTLGAETQVAESAAPAPAEAVVPTTGGGVAVDAAGAAAPRKRKATRMAKREGRP